MRFLSLCLMVVVILAVFASMAMAAAEGETNPDAAVANVSGLQPFTAEANYMSLPGYLRYQGFVATSTWMTRLEAVREVKIQNGDPTLGCPDAMVLNGCRKPK